VAATSGSTTGATIPGGPSDLFTSVGTISASVKNTGNVTGAEVAQLYISLPSSAPSTPLKQLRGFQKLSLEANQADTASFSLTRRDISYWNTEQQKWVVPSGTYSVNVGSSSRDIRLTGSFTI
jgi:beta-glucosidase